MLVLISSYLLSVIRDIGLYTISTVNGKMLCLQFYKIYEYVLKTVKKYILCILSTIYSTEYDYKYVFINSTAHTIYKQTLFNKSTFIFFRFIKHNRRMFSITSNVVAMLRYLDCKLI